MPYADDFKEGRRYPYGARQPHLPCTWFAPRCDGKEGVPFRTAYEVMMNWGASHGADLITMCSMLRIPACTHNVPMCLARKMKELL